MSAYQLCTLGQVCYREEVWLVLGLRNHENTNISFFKSIVHFYTNFAVLRFFNEGGVAALRISELLPGFWSKMWKFIRPFMKSHLKKGTLNPKVEKMALLPFFFTVFVKIFVGDKIANFSPRDHIVLAKHSFKHSFLFRYLNNLIIFGIVRAI